MPTFVDHLHLLPLFAAALVPVVLYLLDRRRARVVDWPALRFLTKASPRELRRLHWLEVVLLAVRTLVVVALVAAVVQPFLRERRHVLGAPGESARGFVLVFDTSLSMAYRATPGEPSNLELARAAAFRLLDSVSSRDEIVVLADSDGGAQAANAPRDPHDQIRALEPGPAVFHLDRELDRAIAAAGRLDSPLREIFVFTDLAASTIDASGLERLRETEPSRNSRGGAKIRIVECRPASTRNSAVVRLSAGRLAGTDRVADVAATIASPAAEPLESLLVRFFDGGEEFARQRADFRGEPSASIAVSRRFETPGEHVVRARIPADGLPIDDIRYLIVDVLDATRILVVGDGTSDSSSARLVDLAFAPARTDAAGTPTLFEPELARDLSAEQLERYAVIVFADVARIEGETARRLERYVASGGGLLVFLGPATNTDAWNDELYRGEHGLLPARLSTGETAAESGSAHPADLSFSHPALEHFGRPGSGDLSRIDVRSWIEFTEVARGAEILASLAGTNGRSPWIVEKRYGRGRVTLVATSASAETTTLPRSTLFVPLLHELARSLLAPRESSRNLHVGEEIVTSLEDLRAADDLHVIAPTGETLALKAELRDGRAVGVFTRTRTPGLYRLGRRDGSTGAAATYAVNVPAAESDLSRVAEETANELSTRFDLAVVSPSSPLGEEPIEVVTRRDLWPLCLSAALALLLLELVVLRRLTPDRVTSTSRE